MWRVIENGMEGGVREGRERERKRVKDVLMMQEKKEGKK